MAQKTTDALTKQELQERWKHLELKTGTLLHLQEVLDRRGIMAAVTVTDVVAREKRPKMVDMGKEWSFEELRLISLEGIRPHLMNLVRFVLEALIAWRFIQVPDSALDGVVEVALAGLFCLFGIGAICVTCYSQGKGKTARSKRRALMAHVGGVLRIPRRKRAKALPSKASSH
jgi:hypothetical protein